MIKILTSLLFITLSSPADEIKDSQSTQFVPVTMDANKNNVRPDYKQIDNSSEKSKEFSWGTVYYTSITRDQDHDHSEKLQTHMNLRFVCKNGASKNLKMKRFEFCGYAKSEEDTKARAHTIAEMKKFAENKGKSDADLNTIYDQEYNNRIVDPIWNISDKNENGKISVEITVRQNMARFGACEEKISNLSLPVDCK